MHHIPQYPITGRLTRKTNDNAQVTKLTSGTSFLIKSKNKRRCLSHEVNFWDQFPDKILVIRTKNHFLELKNIISHLFLELTH